jgi:choline dehydrogenase-like flavoprotein
MTFLPDLIASEPHWNIAQYLLWVMTRDAATAAAASDRNPDMPNMGRYVAALLWESRQFLGTDDPHAVREQARAQALAALSSGRVKSSGIPQDATMPRRIEPFEWGHLDVFYDHTLAPYIQARNYADHEMAGRATFRDILVDAIDIAREFPPTVGPVAVALHQDRGAKSAAISDAVAAVYPGGVPEAEAKQTRNAKLVEWIKEKKGLLVSDRLIRSWFSAQAAHD